MIRDFTKFIARGNVIDLAVGIVIGAAFTSVVNSFVNDLLMPPIGALTGGVGFTDLFIVLSDGKTPGPYASLAAAKAAGAATLNYGQFINAMISFLLVGFAVFLMVKAYNRLREQGETGAATPAERPCPYCLGSVPLAATRCAYCTSELAPAQIPASS